MLDLINEKRSEYLMTEAPHLYVEDELLLPYPSHAPPPAPPTLSKYQLYGDPAEFAHVDEIAISVSKSCQAFFIWLGGALPRSLIQTVVLSY